MALNKRQNRRSNDITLSLLLFFFFLIMKLHLNLREILYGCYKLLWYNISFFGNDGEAR